MCKNISKHGKVPLYVGNLWFVMEFCLQIMAKEGEEMDICLSKIDIKGATNVTLHK